MNCNPIHEVRSWAKVRSIARTIRCGKPVPPYVIDGVPGNCNLITGTHRQAANMLLERMGDPSRVAWVQLCSFDGHPAKEEIDQLIEDGNFSEINFLIDEVDIFNLV